MKAKLTGGMYSFRWQPSTNVVPKFECFIRNYTNEPHTPNRKKATMSEIYISGKTIDRSSEVVKGEYEDCVFNAYSFAGANLSDYKFVNCEFTACDFSMAKLTNTAFRDVVFNECKMLGLAFNSCNVFGLSFSFNNCHLNHSSFYKTKLKKIVFRDSQLKDADFTEADLSGVVFAHCDLDRAVFNQTNLEKADFSTAYNFSLDPENNRMKKAKFSASTLGGLLGKYDLQIER